MKPALLAALLALLPAGAARAAAPHSLEVDVVAVADGDTITVLDSNQLQHRIRLAGIDAPEKGQPFSERSRQALAAWVHGKRVTIEWSKTDRYGRFVAIVRALPPGDCAPPCMASIDVNLAQVGAGMAWHYKDYEGEQSPTDRRTYAAAEQQARAQHLGIWSQADATPPWEMRRGKEGGMVKKSRNGICHARGMSSYSSVQRYESFPTLDACITSGGRMPKGVAQ